MDAFAELLRPLLGSAAVLGGLLLVRRRVAAAAGPRSRGQLRVAERVAVGRGSAVVVVEVDERRFLVGAGEQGLRLLSELTPPPPGAAAAEVAPALGEPARWEPGPGEPGPREPRPGESSSGESSSREPAVRVAADPPAAGAGVPGGAVAWDGPLDRLRRATVRTHVEAPLRERT